MKLLLLLLSLILLPNCTRVQEARKHDKKFFLVSHAGAGDPFWNIEFKGAKAAAIANGIDLQILAPETPNDLARQVELLNAAIASNPAGVATTIPDDNALSPSLLTAQKMGIPVVAFNARPEPGTNTKNPYLAFVGMNEFLAGQLLAQRAFSTNKLHDSVVVAIHQAGHIGLERRYAGIKQVLNAKNISVIKLDITPDESQAQQIMKGFLIKNKKISAIFFVGSHGLRVLNKFLKEEYPHLPLASFDLTPLTLDLIREGAVEVSIDQQPYMQGYMSVAQLVLAADYKIHPSDLNTGAGLVDRSNFAALNSLVKEGIR